MLKCKTLKKYNFELHVGLMAGSTIFTGLLAFV